MNKVHFPAGFFAAAFIMLITANCSRQPVYPQPRVSGQYAVIETAALEQDVPRFYTYFFNGRKVNFFVIRMNHAVVSFLDACTSCSVHKRGYRYQAGAVRCSYCNMAFPVQKLEKGLGGCYPIRLEGRAENETYLIPIKQLEKAAGKF